MPQQQKNYTKNMTNSMNRSNLLRRLIGGISVIAVVAIITFSGCTNIDDSLGLDSTLDDQSMKIGQLSINGSEGNYFESRLYKTDSINSSNLSYGYFGAMGNDTFGTRSAGFLTQYIASYGFDDEDELFGYDPIIDSVLLYLSVTAYNGDTTVVQKFEVFEILDNSFISESADSIFFSNFDPEPYVDDSPLFTFNFPDARNGVYTTSTIITMQSTEKGDALIHRLLLEDETADYDYEIYEDEEEFIEEFKGLYIRRADDLQPITAGSPGAIFATDLAASGIGFYGRNRVEDDPTLIQDTIDMSYVFYWDYAEAGNISINCIEHNYEGSLIDLSEVRTPEQAFDATPLVSTLRVEGMAGVVSQITMTKELFETLDTILETEEAESGEVYSTLFFNQAQLKIYMEQVDGYDYTQINPYLVTPWMNVMPTYLGLYTDYSLYLVEDEDDEDVTYSTLTGITDYLYEYESSYTLDFDGGLNRSWGCYVMNISGHLQACWNLYLAAKEEAEENGTQIDWDDVSERTMYLAPTASNLFSMIYASLQAGDTEANSAPMSLDLTYTMIR